MQAKLSASQYGFRAGVFTETALHEFVHRVVEMATAQHTRPCAVVGVPRRVATKICITSLYQRSAAY